MSIDSVEMLKNDSSGLTPIAIPDAKSIKTGVSVKYAPDDSKAWFVLRASYGREDLVSDLLIDQGIYAYTVKRYNWKLINGKRRKVLESLLPNMVFSYMTPCDADLLVRDVHPAEVTNPCPQLSVISSYYYNHCLTDSYGMNPPVQVPGDRMVNFILGTCSHDENIVPLVKGDYHFVRTDDLVEVIGGPFKGVRGRVIRAGGQQRILLRLTSMDPANVLGEFGTAFIPMSLMRIVE